MAIKKVKLDIKKLSSSQKEMNKEVKEIIGLEEAEIREALDNNKTMKSIVDELNRIYKPQLTSVKVSYPDPKGGKMITKTKKPTITSQHIRKVLEL